MMITIFSKPDCMQCEFAKRYLDDRGIKYEEIDVFKNDEGLAMLRDAGYTQMPVVDIDGDKHTGFHPEILAKLVG